MSRARSALPALAVLLCPSLAWAGGTVVLAPLIPKGIDDKAAHNITGLLSSELDFSGEFDSVNELATMPPTLKDSCLTSTSCLSAIAKGNGGDALVVGTVGPGPDGVQIFLVYYDVAKNTIVRKKTFNTPKEASEIADRATSMVKELVTGVSSETAKAEAAPTAIVAANEEEEFEFDAKAPPKPAATTSKTSTTTTAKTTGTTKAPPAKAPAKGLDDGDEMDADVSVPVARDDGPDFDEPEQEEQAAKAKAQAEARAKAEAEEKARELAEAKAEAEAAAKAKAAAEARAKAEAEARAREEAEEEARQAAEEAARAKAAADAAAKAKAAADAQAKADAAAKAAAAKAAASKPASTSGEFSFGSGAGAIVMDDSEDEEDVEETPPPKPASTASTSSSTKRNYYDHEPEDDSDRYADLDSPTTKPTKSTTTTSTRTSAPVDDEDLDSPPTKSTSTKSSTASRSTAPDDEEENLDDAESLDLDEPAPTHKDTRTSSSTSSRTSNLDADSRGSTKTTSSRDEDDDRPGVTLTGRGGYARFEDFNFVTYGGEIGVPMGKSAALLAGIAGFSTQRHFTDDDVAYISQTTGVDPADVDRDPWNTILPFNFGVVYKTSGTSVRPYAGADIVLAPYTAAFDLAVGARIRLGADFMVADNFGFNLDLAAGVLSGKEFAGIDAGLKNTGLLPQASLGTVFRF